MPFAFSLVVGLALLGQEKPLTSKELNPSERPILSVKGLNAKDIVSVSRYTTKDSPYPSMVYRYVFRGDYKKTLQAFQATLMPKEGWKIEAASATEQVLSRNLAKGPIAMQALLFHPTRLVPGPKGWRPAQGKDAKGWIWVSYNELVRTKK